MKLQSRAKSTAFEEELDAMKRKKKLELTADDLMASADAYAEKAEAQNDVTLPSQNKTIQQKVLEPPRNGLLGFFVLCAVEAILHNRTIFYSV